MMLFTILLLTLLLITILTVFAISAGGAVFIVLFGDVIVCAVIIIWVMKHIISKNKK